MEKQKIVDAHNSMRQMIAMGGVKGQPAATNMREMLWDEELAIIAQRWADQCMPGHDHRRNVGKYLSLIIKTWFYNNYQIDMLLDRMWQPPGHIRECHQ